MRITTSARCVSAGAVYALCAFAVGFAAGTFRVFFLEPRVGSVAAVAFELPVMLAVSWMIARTVVGRMWIDRSLASRAKMGLAGLAVLVALELTLGLLFGRSLGAMLADYASARGVLTLLGQLGFALMPLIV